MANNGIYINSDTWNFWLAEPLEEMGRDEIVEAIFRDVDFYTARGGVRAVFYNMNGQRSFYPTKIGTPFWKDLEIGGDGHILLRGKPISKDWGDDSRLVTMLRRSKRTMELVPDMMALRYARCHRNGAEMWHSMRVNDVHHTCLGLEFLPYHCDLWLDRKDLVRAWYRHAWRGEWRDNALDFGRREVFDYAVAMMREYLLDYESDGIELDWLRCCPVFAPGFDEANTPILTAFMRQTRKAADEAAAKWGHPVGVAARVPSRVREAYGMGMDIAEWTRERLVDIVIPSCRDVATDMDCDVAIYRALCPRPTVLAPDIDYLCISSTDTTSHLKFGADTDCGFASGWYHDGADSVYLYNHYPLHAAQEPVEHPGFPEDLEYLGNRGEVARRPRRCVLTRHQPMGEGNYFVSQYPDFIWAKCCNGGVKVNCGENVAGREARVVFGTSCDADLTLIVNTVECPLLPANAEIPFRMPKLPEGSVPHFRQAILPGGLLHDGWNNVEFFNGGDRDLRAMDFIWLEIAVT